MFTWIRYDQDNDEKYLTLKTDGTVVLSYRGKFKVTNPLEPSASIRQLFGKFVISLDDIAICANGVSKPLSACSKSQSRKMRFSFIETKYGTMIENEGLCITKGMELFEDSETLNEWEAVLLPCDSSVEQMFTIHITDHVNYEKI